MRINMTIRYKAITSNPTRLSRLFSDDYRINQKVDHYGDEIWPLNRRSILFVYTLVTWVVLFVGSPTE
jgi:hypothetical protein